MADARRSPVAILDNTEITDIRERQNAVLGGASQLWHIISVVAELGIADLLATEPRTVAELAQVTETDTGALRRVLRCAASVGIFAEQPDGRFAMSELAQGLLSDRIGGLRPMIRFHSMDWVRRSYREIMHSVRTGEPAFDRAFGMSFHQYLGENPEFALFYEGFLAHFSRRLADRFVGQLGLDRFSRICDIGAGTGYFLARMLQAQPKADGLLIDRPVVTEGAGTIFAEHGVSDRATVRGADILDSTTPSGYDLYTLKTVLHRLDDNASIALLRQIRNALGDTDGRIIVIDQILPEGNAWDHSKVIDIDALVLYGGKERYLDEWHELADASGLRLCADPVLRGWTFLEFQAA